MRENNTTEDDAKRIRRRGGGRKSVKEKYPEIVKEITSIVEDSAFRNPENPLTYTIKSTRKIKQILNEKEEGHF